MSLLTSGVVFDKEKETYVHEATGSPYHRVSNVISSFKPEFPRLIIARRIAEKEKISVDEVLENWEQTKLKAIARGNIIHKAIEEYENRQIITDVALKDFVMKMHTEFEEYNETYNEKILFSNDYVVAGTADKLAFRTKNIVNIYDYKTNLSRGIEFVNKYDKYMLAPLDHLMDCNYNHYSLQLSTYAYFLENTYKYRIGKLTLIYIPPDNPMEYTKIPVPYMKSEAKLMLDTYKKINAIEPIVEIENWG